MKFFLPIYLFISITPLFSFSQQAPPIQWAKTYGGTGTEFGEGVIQTHDGGYIYNGGSNSNNGGVTGNHGNTDYWIVKIDSNKVVKWQQSYGGSEEDDGYRMLSTADGGYIIAGRSFSNDGQITGHHGSTSTSDVWLVKIDSTGVLQWQKSYGGSNNDGLQGLAVTKDGYIFTATSNSTDGDVTGNHGGNDYWVVKTDTLGAIQWEHCYGGSGDDEAFCRPVLTKDGGYIIGGESQSNDGDVSGNHGGYDDWILKLDSVGVIQWQNSYGGAANDGASTIVQNYDSSYTVLGGSNSGNTGQVTGAHGGYDFWVVKIDKTGGLLWEKSFGGSLDDYPSVIKITADSGFVLSGHSKSSNGDLFINRGGWDFWVLKLSQSGNLQWQKSMGGSGDDIDYDIITTKDNGYATIGQTFSNDHDVTGNQGSGDYWVVKLGTDTLLGADTLLPVTLLNFASINKSNQNILNWTTENEINFDHFDVQRSSDGRLFNTIGTVAGEKSSQLVQNYHFVDNNITNLSYYYRLREADKDNHITYSRIIFLNTNNFNSSTKIYPNPAHSVVTVVYHSAVETDIALNCFDMTGKLVGAQNVRVYLGVNTINLDVSRYATGAYNIVIGKDNIKTQKIIKY